MFGNGVIQHTTYVKPEALCTLNRFAKQIRKCVDNNLRIQEYVYSLLAERASNFATIERVDCCEYLRSFFHSVARTGLALPLQILDSRSWNHCSLSKLQYLTLAPACIHADCFGHYEEFDVLVAVLSKGRSIN